MTPALCSATAYQAASILEAWNTGDSQRLSAALEGALAPPPFPGLPSAELERTELLQAVVAEIRQTRLASPADAPASERIEVCMGLLQHLGAQSF